ncbi:hypothetical protein [Christiangramia sp. SM2212]|uniref:Uncharacterized protein n=1 Tax=Christiangramia sediminicola TaxID=3073267 RepID=A0ABU1ENR6_9FLAO|nr:hypothetical protein [Christiangramia sp. SM2212]MDR5590028.1 hypothetical protein [Christiangramia sp. SM2212]
MKKTKLIMLAASLSIFASCEKEIETPGIAEVQKLETPAMEFRPLENNSFNIKLPDNTDSKVKSKIGDYNISLFSAEYITANGSEELGTTIFFTNRGNKMLSSDFVPGLAYDGTSDISYYIDKNRPSNDIDVKVSTAAIGRAMDSWRNVNCSDIGLYEIPYDEVEEGEELQEYGVFAYFYGIFSGNDFGGAPLYIADVYHGGWLGAEFFDYLTERGSEFILGVTLTYTFTDEDGNLVDTDNNGKADVAFREIYYNDTFTWNDGRTYDIETIALHEAGHGLSQAHFGEAFRTNANGKIHFSPRAVMNATYSGIQTAVEKTDEAGHCANWAEWPNK